MKFKIIFFLIFLFGYSQEGFMSGQNYVDISLGEMVESAPLIVRAKFLGDSKDNSISKNFLVDSLVYSGNSKSSSIMKKEIAVFRAGSYEWSKSMHRAERTGMTTWTLVKSFSPNTELKVGEHYIVFIVPTGEHTYDFFAEGSFLPVEKLAEVEGYLKNKTANSSTNKR